MLLTDFGNLNSILNIFQETHKFLDLTDLLIICIYLRTTDRHFRDQGNVHHLTSKLLKCNLVQTLNTSRNPSLRIFAAGKASLVSLYMHWYQGLLLAFLTLKNSCLLICRDLIIRKVEKALQIFFIEVWLEFIMKLVLFTKNLMRCIWQLTNTNLKIS